MKNLIAFFTLLVLSSTQLSANGNTFFAEVIRKEVATPTKKEKKQTKKELRQQQRAKKRLERKRKRAQERKHTKLQWGTEQTKGKGKSNISNPFLDIGLASLAVMIAAPFAGQVITYSIIYPAYSAMFSTIMLIGNIFGILGLVAMVAAIVFSVIGFTKLKKSREVPDGFDWNLFFGITSVITAIICFTLLLGGAWYGLPMVISLLAGFTASIFGIFFNKRQLQKRPEAARIRPTIND